MAKESDETPKITEKILPRDKEVIVLAALFFWGKYMRRKVNSADFMPDMPEVDFDDPISILKAGFELKKQANTDIGGNAAKAISAIILEHPKRHEIIPHLPDTEVRDICSDLDEMFENQEFCAQCEDWTYYELEPKDFTIMTTTEMLWHCSNIHSYINRKDNFMMGWFGNIYSGDERGKIVEAVLKEKLFGKFSGFLPPAVEQN